MRPDVDWNRPKKFFSQEAQCHQSGIIFEPKTLRREYPIGLRANILMYIKSYYRKYVFYDLWACHWNVFDSTSAIYS